MKKKVDSLMNIFMCMAFSGNGDGNGKVILVTNLFWIEGSPERILEKIIEYGITRENIEAIIKDKEMKQ